MRFYEEKDLSKIIGHFKKDNNYYQVSYLDGDIVEYFNSDKNHEEELMNRMLKDAIERDKNLYEKYKNYLPKDLIQFILTLFALGLSTNIKFLFCTLFVFTIYQIKTSISDIIKYAELEKYHNYFLIKDDLEKEENKDILNVIEFEKMYQIPINPNTIDGYSALDMRTLKKEINRRKGI